MKPYRSILVLSGALATAGIAFASTMAHGPALIRGLETQAAAARDGAGGKGIEISFRTAEGWLTRHPGLSGGDALDVGVRGRVASAIAAVPGIGGARWTSDDAGTPSAGESGPPGRHCQDDVAAMLKTRTIRFAEASAAIDPASQQLLNEVAAALRPCLGSIIAITGHTDSAGDPGANLALSRARADAVRWALVARGIPADGLRASGLGAQQALEGLDPSDPANRRIEFSVIESAPVRPTVVDTPGPG